MVHGSGNVNILNITSVNIDSTMYIVAYVDEILSFCEQFSVVIDH